MSRIDVISSSEPLAQFFFKKNVECYSNIWATIVPEYLTGMLLLRSQSLKIGDTDDYSSPVGTCKEPPSMNASRRGKATNHIPVLFLCAQ